METDGAISTTCPEDVAMSVWQREKKEIQGKFPLNNSILLKMIFKMKARIKKTGEIINIASYVKVTLDLCDSYGNPMELGFDEVEILQEPTSDIDWEERRYEIAKSMIAAFLSNSNVAV